MSERYNTYTLHKFINNLRNYEPGIINIIKYYTKTYTFNSNEELQHAVELWYYKNYIAAKKAGVNFLAYRCKISPKEILIEKKLKILNA